MCTEWYGGHLCVLNGMVVTYASYTKSKDLLNSLKGLHIL